LNRALPLCVLAALAAALWLAPPRPTSAYVSIRVSPGPAGQGLPVRWDLSNTQNLPNVRNRRILYEIADAGTADAGGFQGPVTEFEAVQNSFANWRRIRGSELDFEFIGATTNAVTDGQDRRNVIRWVGADANPGVFAVTITTFDTVTGRILDADMELNDRDFTWDTLGPTGTRGIIGRAMIESVVTHEIGHLAGLDHSSLAASSMYFAAATGMVSQTRLRADDHALMIRDYSAPDFRDPALGAVQGSVSSGGPVAGVEVVLVNAATGRAVISHLSAGVGPEPVGSLRVDNVPPGVYYALARPVDRQNLGPYYSNAFINFFPVLHGVAVNTVATPALLRVGPGATVTGLDISLPAGGQNPFEPDNSSGSATAISSGQAAVAAISPASDQDWFQFTTTVPDTRVHVRVLAHGFGSLLNPTLTLFAPDGTTVLASPVFGHAAYTPTAKDIYEDAFDLQGANFDAEITRVLASPGTYFVRVASRQGTTAGPYVLMLEFEGEDDDVDPVASMVEASAPGVAAGGAGQVGITVTPRNRFGRDLTAPATFDVELLDVTGASPVVLETRGNAQPPIDFVVSALATAQTRRYSARVAGTSLAGFVAISHYGAFSAANSRLLTPERSLTANGSDRVPIYVDVRDGANNARPDLSTSVVVSTTAGVLDNGAAQGADVAAVFDPATGWWRVELIAPQAAGNITVSAQAAGQAIGSAQIAALPRATGTGGGAPKDKKKGSSGCAAAAGGAGLWLLMALYAFSTRQRLSRNQRRAS
jgi:hypothetical protein